MQRALVIGRPVRVEQDLTPRKGRKPPHGYKTFGSGAARLDHGLTLRAVSYLGP